MSNVVCTNCGTGITSKHTCQTRLTYDEVEPVIDDFLNDLAGRSGFRMSNQVRVMIRGEWIALLRGRFGA